MAGERDRERERETQRDKPTESHRDTEKETRERSKRDTPTARERAIQCRGRGYLLLGVLNRFIVGGVAPLKQGPLCGSIFGSWGLFL